MDVKYAVLRSKTTTLKRADGAMYRRLLADQYLEREELETLQRARGAQLAALAWDRTDFYREHYSGAGLTRADVADPAAFFELPLVEKAHLREHSARFRVAGVPSGKTRVSSTGGSTGEPVKLLHDARVPFRTISWRMFDWWGVRASDNIAHVYRNVRAPLKESIHNLQWWPTRSLRIDAYRMDDAHIDDFVRRFTAVRPRLLIGYVGGVHELAGVIERRGLELPAVTAVGVTAAPLSGVQRATIERVFGGPVYDHYRCGEIPWVAAECAVRDGLHTFGDVRLMEIVDDAGQRVPDGTTGQTVITDLTNRAFPLLRYRIGDRSALRSGSCPCGVKLPLMDPVRGRVSDALVLPDGQIVAGEGLTAIFDDQPDAVRAFQVYQGTDANIRLRCVPGPDPAAREGMQRVCTVLRSMVKGKVDVSLEVVDDLPHDGGKIRYIVSDYVRT